MPDNAWIAIAGGAGALVGGIGAQFVNARYARRRADKDLTHNQWGHWRDERLASYLDLFSAVESWLKIYSAFRAQTEITQGLSKEDNGDKIKDYIHFNSVAIRYGETVSAHYVKVRTLGSAEFVALATDLDRFLQVHIDWQRSVIMGINFRIASAGESWNEIFETRDRFETAVRSRVNSLVIVARDDLGSDAALSNIGIVARVIAAILRIPAWHKRTWSEIKDVRESKAGSGKDT